MIHSRADITPGGTAAALATARTPANWLMVSAPAANAADIRIGESTASATVGGVIVKGTSVTFPPIGDSAYLDLSKIFVYGGGTDKVSIVWGTK